MANAAAVVAAEHDLVLTVSVSAVPEKQRVSMLWLEWVIASGRIVPYQARGSVACRPFPFPLPLPGMSDIRCVLLLPCTHHVEPALCITGLT